MSNRAYARQILNKVLVIVTGLLVCGILLTAVSVVKSPITPTTASASVKAAQWTLRMSTGVPGLILVTLGVICFILLLIKIPVKEILQGGAGPNKSIETMGYRTAESKDTSHKMPLLIYWILGKRMGIIPIEKGEENK